ncbi:uncharacterized protein LOC113230276 [Hyposmocoma kahamanoa]|uniref:uncharacterized protein LOC113230276 n=1 Tax=Hyposmocoma kahamanoa TaxID=1477025 RepID=UPI000E6D9C20|nr:uncharacterized protein LOC113230276 [Hyposmocoma kahamanoa]
MYWLAVLMLTATGVSAQTVPTAMSSVAPELRECYMNVTLLNRNNLPPATMPVLIDIIRKIEDNPNNVLDLRQLSVLLLHTYRQDGIEFHPQENVNLANVLLFSPTFHSFHRHRLLVTRIIQASGSQSLNNDTISSDLKCALHHMLSTTVDFRVRGDESSCNQLSQYRIWRHVRSINDDVEILDPSLIKNGHENGQINEHKPDDDVEIQNYGNSFSERQLLANSQCPLLGGVVSTPWGAVSAGHVIAGIAAGTQPQQVPISDLTRGSVNLNDYRNVQQTVTPIFPATLSGDLAEAALIQGTERGSATSVSIGVAGGWNSTQARRYLMLQSSTNVQMTDPEIRGDVDGFVLGTVIQSALNIYNGLKLSQVLDMYYSPLNGVFQSEMRACNRQALGETHITMNTLTAETRAFAAALDSNIPLRGTIVGGLDQLVSSAVNNFQSYMTSNLNDQNCVTTQNTLRDYRLATNLYIVLDGSWPYLTVYPAISHLVDIIEVNKFGSSITLLSAADGSIVVNKTFSLADFHTEYTATRHQAMMTSINLETTLTNVRIMMHNELDHERTSNYVGGNSTVLLFLLHGQVQSSQQTFEQARILNETVPDLRILFATSTNQFDNLWTLVRDMHNDIMTVSLTGSDNSVATSMSRVVDRIQQTGRRIINPTCGSTYNSNLSGTRQFDDFVEPGFINFYSVSPNYFYLNNDNRRVRISRTSGQGSLTVCHSRRITQPRQNSTVNDNEDDTICQTIAASGEVEIRLQNACSGYSTINTCPLLYVSVQSNAVAASTASAICTDQRCRFPYNNRYMIQINDFDCFSSANRGVASFVVIIAVVMSVFYI